MAKRTDLNKILVIGSGPIVIGQAAEFDYAGTQALSLIHILSGKATAKTVGAVMHWLHRIHDHFAR